MSLLFQNLYRDPAYISLVWFDPACGAVPWRKQGWFKADPGATVEVVKGDLRNVRNHNFAWFAVARDSSGPTWAGDTGYRVPLNAAFNQCHMDDTGCNVIRQFFVGRLSEDWMGVTIVLVAPGAADQPNQGFVWGIPIFPPEPPKPKPPKPGPHK
jgi:hypothetical protein